ncbi:putative glycolipid-binding domain-containing protein [Alkalihalophilus lindianensis]|uniref:putative glycolipid-binding domain-containing protein n=1 Tax=Alkalihalophilus lindianensis TaxID=1630542 RepID=UPI0034DEFF9C
MPTLETKKVPQTYTYLYQEGSLRFFHYRCYSYQTTISVDEEGLVISYPNVFHKMV